MDDGKYKEIIKKDFPNLHNTLNHISNKHVIKIFKNSIIMYGFKNTGNSVEKETRNSEGFRKP